MLPRTAWAQADADADGVPDAADAYPCDPLRVGVLHAPAQGEHGMLLFEDQWPSQGDLDFNDLVVTYNARATLTGPASGVQSLLLTYNVLAVGGRFDNGLAVHLPVPTSAVQQVWLRTSSDAPLQPVSPIATETELTVVLSENVRALFGGRPGQINSVVTDPVEPGATIEVEIMFSQPVALDFGAAPFDVFIFRTTDPSHEIHRPAYRGTSRMNATRFGTADDGTSSTRSFVDRQGLPFVLHVPNGTPWPREAVPVDTLWPNIVQFAASAGTQARDFYTQPGPAEAAYPGAGILTPRFFADPSVPSTPDTSCLGWLGTSTFGNPGTNSNPRVAFDPSGGSVVIGLSNAQVVPPVNAAGPGSYIARFDANNVLLWGYQIAGWIQDLNLVRATIDESGRVYAGLQVNQPLPWFGQTLPVGYHVLSFEADGTPRPPLAIDDLVVDVAADAQGVWVLQNRRSRSVSGANQQSFVRLEHYSPAGQRLAQIDGLLRAEAPPGTWMTTRGHRLAVLGPNELGLILTEQHGSTFYQRWLTLDPATLQRGWELIYLHSLTLNFTRSYLVFPSDTPMVSDGAGGVYGAWNVSGAYSGRSGLDLSGSWSSRRAEALVGHIDATGRLAWVSRPVSPEYGPFMRGVAAGPGGPVFCGHTRGIPGQTASGYSDSLSGRMTSSGSNLWLASYGVPNEFETLRACTVAGASLRSVGLRGSALLFVGEDIATGARP